MIDIFYKEKLTARLMIDYLLELTADIQEDLFHSQLIKDSISPAWVLGHLCLETVKTAASINIQLTLDPEWEEYFCQGSSAKDVPKELTKEILRSTFSSTLDEFIYGLEKVDTEKLTQKNHSKALASYLPELQHDVSHVITTHLAIHAGQIGMWR